MELPMELPQVLQRIIVRASGMAKWQLQEAKNRLSEVVRKTSGEGPQVITLRGDDVVVVNEYARLTRRPKGSIVDFFRRSPLGGVSLELAGSRDTGRDVKL
jgi:prevent-host-death family protein